MATRVRALGNYVWINNVRFNKNSLSCDHDGELWTIRGDPPQVIVSGLDYRSCIDEDSGRAFDSEQDFENWLNENAMPVSSNQTSANNYGLPVLVNNSQPVFLLGNSARVHLIDCTNGQTDVYLPGEDNGAVPGLVFTIKKIDDSDNFVIIHASDGYEIEGDQDIPISSQQSFRTVIYDGENWWVIGYNGN